jgi:hypothetical protein
VIAPETGAEKAPEIGAAQGPETLDYGHVAGKGSWWQALSLWGRGHCGAGAGSFNELPILLF